jgi:hypothetical protein
MVISVLTRTYTNIKVIPQVWDLELVKSNLINNGAYIDWENYQYVLNHFTELNQDKRSISQLISQGMKQIVTGWTDAFQTLSDALKNSKYKDKIMWLYPFLVGAIVGVCASALLFLHTVGWF